MSMINSSLSTWLQEKQLYNWLTNGSGQFTVGKRTCPALVFPFIQRLLWPAASLKSPLRGCLCMVPAQHVWGRTGTHTLLSQDMVSVFPRHLHSVSLTCPTVQHCGLCVWNIASLHFSLPLLPTLPLSVPWVTCSSSLYPPLLPHPALPPPALQYIVLWQNLLKTIGHQAGGPNSHQTGEMSVEFLEARKLPLRVLETWHTPVSSSAALHAGGVGTPVLHTDNLALTGVSSQIHPLAKQRCQSRTLFGKKCFLLWNSCLTRKIGKKMLRTMP